MPAKSEIQVQHFLSNIKRLLVIDGDMSLREMQRQLEENGIHLHLDYINKLRRKAFQERIREVDRMTLNLALSAAISELSETKRQMWPILLSNASTRREKANAARVIKDIVKEVFELLFNAGVFKRQLGEIESKFSMVALLKEIKEDAKRAGETTNAEGNREHSLASGQ